MSAQAAIEKIKAEQGVVLAVKDLKGALADPPVGIWTPEQAINCRVLAVAKATCLHAEELQAED